MKRFRFSLETVLQLRRRKEEEIKLTLAAKNNQIAEAQKHMASIHEELKNLQATQKASRRNPDILQLRYSVVYRHKLKQDILKKGREIDDLNADAFKIRQRLTEARRRVRAVELVREKRLAEWKKEYNAQQQEFIDDISQQAYIRAHNVPA